MLTLIHGDDIVASRKALDELKAKFTDFEKISFAGERITLNDIIVASESRSLFDQQKMIVIENLVGGGKTYEREQVLNFLQEKKILPEVVVWEGKEVANPILKKYFHKAKIICFQPPAILFKFLDSIGEKPITIVLSMFHRVTAEREVETILPMLIRQWRYLIIAKDLGERGFVGMPSWQAFKFISQARHFNLQDLIASYRQLVSLEAKVKMGLTSYTFSQLLDIFFVSLYYQF